MHLSLALLVLLFSLILSNVINRVFPRLPLPLIQIIFGVGIGFLLKGRAFELETELFLAFIIAPCCFGRVKKVISPVFYVTGNLFYF